MKLPLKLNNENDIYYNCKYCYSFQMFFNCIDGGRGIGKTTTFLIDGLHQCEKGKQFIYLRRYKSEIKEFVHKDSLSPIIDGIVYKGDGNGGYAIVYEDTILGYIIPLSTYRAYKSTSFELVTRIIYDEAIVRQTATYRYLEDEAVSLLEFVSTVFRTRTNGKVILLGNNEDIFNPFFNFFDIPVFVNTYVDKNHGIYCEHAKHSPKLIEKEKQTGLYNLIKDTTYGKYHYDNDVLTTHEYNIGNKPSTAKLLCRFVFNKQTVNVYTVNNTSTPQLYFERRDKIIKDNITYVFLEDGKVNYLYIETYRRKLKAFVYRHWFNKLVMYNDEKCGAIMQWLIDEA